MYEICLSPTPRGWEPRLREDGLIVASGPSRTSRYPHEALDAAIEMIGRMKLELDREAQAVKLISAADAD